MGKKIKFKPNIPQHNRRELEKLNGKAQSFHPSDCSSVAQSCLTDCFVTPWTVARQAPLSMGFPRQDYWSGLPCPPPGHLPDPGMEPESPALAGGFSTTNAIREDPTEVTLGLYSLPWWLSDKESACYAKGAVQSLGLEDPLEESTATHSSSLAWKTPWTEEPGGLQSMGLQRVRHD